MGNSSSREGGILSVESSCSPLTGGVSWSGVEVFLWGWLFVVWAFLMCFFTV